VARDRLVERLAAAGDEPVVVLDAPPGYGKTNLPDLMHSGADLPLCAADQRMAQALVEMTSKSFGCVGVVENNALVGVITDGDLRRHMAPDLTDKTVRAVMTQNPKSVPPSLLAAEALHLMNSRKVTSLFVVDGLAPVGILHIHDLLRAGIA
jgi:arabinose-5-phosphate isomerase